MSIVCICEQIMNHISHKKAGLDDMHESEGCIEYVLLTTLLFAGESLGNLMLVPITSRSYPRAVEGSTSHTH